jgi:hypothetical protein
MYKNNNETETDVLRQGDIISNTQLLGAINLRGITFINNNKNENVGWQCNSKPIFGYAMVLSHSCEIAPENGIKLTSIILAPIRNVDGATDSVKIEALKKSNILTHETKYSFLKYFFLEPTPEIEFINGSIVDFSKIYSLRKESYNDVLSKKILQLHDSVVENITLKFAVYFYRTTGLLMT